MTLRPFGDRAVLVEAASLAEVLTVHDALVASAPDGVTDLVPAARTVLVRVDPARLGLSAARAWIEQAAAAPATGRDRAAASRVELPIRYDGADLADVAGAVGLGVDELIARHLAARWSVAFTGFAPGFAYLVSEDWGLVVPRRPSPRTRVPAGAVGLAGEFSAAYPRETPGGWQLIGTTPARLFDADADRPALLAPGARVQFVREERPVTTLAPPVRVSAPARAALRIVAPGLQATVQDQGRPGHQAEGIGVAGAADRAALRAAHRLVGNDEVAAGIEIALGGFRAVALRDLWIAVTGARGSILRDGREVDHHRAVAWPTGSELHLDGFVEGARAYLAVRGGIAAPLTAGSRATDTLAGIGPAPLRAGVELGLAGAEAAAIPAIDAFPWRAPAGDIVDIDLAPGPRADWFTDEARQALFSSDWVVSSDADRVGIRLEGPALARAGERGTAELPSEGMVAGALQVPPSGRPVILGPDGPVTGGYPVIAVVTDEARDLLGQVVPGIRLRFRHAH